MQIELYIDGEKKVFTTPFVPMLAKRKFLEIESQSEARLKNDENALKEYTVEEFDEMYAILVEIVFQNKFTLEQLLNGASEEYANQKMAEAVFGIKPKPEAEKGN